MFWHPHPPDIHHLHDRDHTLDREQIADLYFAIACNAFGLWTDIYDGDDVADVRD